MGKYFKWGCLGFIAFVAVIFFASIFAMVINSDKSTSTDQGASTAVSDSKEKKTSEKKQEEYVCDVEGVGKVKGAMSSNVGIAIYDVQKMKTLGNNRFARTEAQGQFLVLSIVVANGQKDAVTVDANSFKLKDNSGVEFSYSHEGQMAISVDDKSQKSMLRKINPGIVISIAVPYDIPENMDINQLYLEARGGITGQPIKLPIKVEKVK